MQRSSRPQSKYVSGLSPFSVREAEVRDLFEPDWSVDVLVRRDILAYQDSFRNEGVTALHAVAYRLQRR